MDALSARVGDMKLAADIRASDLSATDYAEMIVRMQAQQTALKATLSVSACLLQPSLLEFIG